VKVFKKGEKKKKRRRRRRKRDRQNMLPFPKPALTPSPYPYSFSHSEEFERPKKKKDASISFFQSNSIRKTAAAVVAEIDELKSVSNARVSPATTTGDYFFQGPKLVVPDRESRDSNSNSLRDDCSETFEMGFRDTASVVGNGERKFRRWSKAWNIWGLINRRGGSNKDERDGEKEIEANFPFFIFFGVQILQKGYG
jgi:hypothetical protein